MPRHRVYVLAGQGEYNNFQHNGLTIIDTDTWQIYKHIPLLRSRATSFNQDPQGRLWIGLSGSMAGDDHRVQIYSHTGDLLATIDTCNNPEAGISFVGEYAFVVCTETGFIGKIDMIHLQTLKSEKTVALNPPTGEAYLLISSIANENQVVIFGLSETGGYLSLIDPRTLEVRRQIGPLEYTDVWTMLPYEKKFYLLNVNSTTNSDGQARNVLILQSDPSETLTAQILPVPSPFLGVIDADLLYLFHNPTWNSTNTDPQRFVSRLALESGKTEHWQLPDEWDATGISVINGQIILANWWPNESERDGLYLFDPTSGQLTQKINIPGAEQIIVGR